MDVEGLKRHRIVRKRNVRLPNAAALIPLARSPDPHLFLTTPPCHAPIYNHPLRLTKSMETLTMCS